jgi:hypothetical protein
MEQAIDKRPGRNQFGEKGGESAPFSPAAGKT